MSDLISRQAAIDAIEEYADRLQMVDWKENPGVPYKAYALNWCINTIRDLPSVTPKQKRGKWEEKAVSDEKVIDEWQSARCSACGKYHTAPYMYYFNNYNFCPNCGARMKEEDA